jgi:hypothetical protein
MGVLFSASMAAAQSNAEINKKIDELVAPSFQTAISSFPCKVKTHGKTKLLDLEQVDLCMNGAADKVDWPVLSAKIEELRLSLRGWTKEDMYTAVEAVLAKHALPYSKIFTIEQPKATLPLSHTILKYLPGDSLRGLRIIDKSGKEFGTFLSVFFYEHSGGTGTGLPYTLAYFQYKDRDERMQTAPDKLLRDNYGIPWQAAKDHPGFCLDVNRLQK